MPGPGEVVEFDRWPLVWSGAPTGPLVHNPPAAIETPDIYRVGVGQLQTFRRWGYPVGYIPPMLARHAPVTWPASESWGIGNNSDELNEWDKHQNPANAAERINYIDVQRCVNVDPADIVTTGVAFELVHTQIPSAAVGVIERVPQIFEEVTALDDQGDPLFTFANLGGFSPCIREVVHPDPAVVTPLTWRFLITQTTVPYRGAPQGAPSGYEGPIIPALVGGQPILGPWSDIRYGDSHRYGDNVDLVANARTLVRYWVILFGPSDRFRVKVGGRLAGYWQQGGRYGAALDGATRRYSR